MGLKIGDRVRLAANDAIRSVPVGSVGTVVDVVDESGMAFWARFDGIETPEYLPRGFALYVTEVEAVE